MLRCSNAHALRTGVENSMAARISLGAGAGAGAHVRWPRAIGTRLSPLARSIQTSGPGGISPAWTSNVKRWYSDVPRPTSLARFDIELPSEQPADPDAGGSKQLDGGEEDIDGTSPRSARKRDDLSSPSGRKASPKVIEMELKWLKDPRELADRVARLLSGDHVVLAQGLVQAAQKERMECSVAWNHVLAYWMKKGEQKTAFKLYNDMKKRGRKPNEHTYTIMLTGFKTAGRNPGFNPVKTAYSVYRSISAQNSAVECSIIHSNAMLNVCSRLGDMDILWRVAGELPEEGPNAPDPTTYTIILRAIINDVNAVRGHAHKSQPQEHPQVMERQATGVKEGKRVWADIVYQWGKGRLTVDNQLVGTMCQILLESGSDRDCYDVLALIHQTTGVPILADQPPKDSPMPFRARQPPPTRPREDFEDVPFVDEGNRLYKPSEPKEEVIMEEEEEENFDNLFDSVVSTDAAEQKTTENASAPSYVPVGNRELSMILEACLTMSPAMGIKTGKAYWDYLTREDSVHKVDPDPHSFHQYLRLLRYARSSRATVDLIRDQMVPSGVIDRKTFHIALSCCRRDRNNPNVLVNANELLALMGENLVLPYPKALEGYLELIRILLDNPLLLTSLNSLMPSKKRSSMKLEALGRELQFRVLNTAIQQLRPSVIKLVDAVEHGAISKELGSSRRPRAESRTHAIPGLETLKVLGQVRALIDSILNPVYASLLPKRTLQPLEMESKDLRKYSKTAVMQKYKNTMVSPTPEQILAFEDRVSEGPASGDRASEDRASEDRASEDRASEDRASEDRASEDR